MSLGFVDFEVDMRTQFFEFPRGILYSSAV
jgi:hypothetical protein